MVGFNVNIKRVVVGLSVGVVRFVVEVECDIEEVDDLEVSLDCNVQSMSFKMSRDVLSYSVCLWSRDIYMIYIYIQFLVCYLFFFPVHLTANTVQEI